MTLRWRQDDLVGRATTICGRYYVECSADDDGDPMFTAWRVHLHAKFQIAECYAPIEEIRKRKRHEALKRICEIDHENGGILGGTEWFQPTKAERQLLKHKR